MLIAMYSLETAGRHLEDLDYLFANNSPFVWNAERDFAAIKSAEAAADRKVVVEALEGEGGRSG